MKKIKVLIIGSAPDSVKARDWSDPPFDHIVAINNAWRIRSDWSNCIFPEDFPVEKQPKANQRQHLNSAEDYVKAQESMAKAFDLDPRSLLILQNLQGTIIFLRDYDSANQLGI